MKMQLKVQKAYSWCYEWNPQTKLHQQSLKLRNYKIMQKREWLRCRNSKSMIHGRKCEIDDSNHLGTSKEDEWSSRTNQKSQITRNLNGTVYLCWAWTRKCRETWIGEMVMELGVWWFEMLGNHPRSVHEFTKLKMIEKWERNLME